MKLGDAVVGMIENHEGLDRLLVEASEASVKLARDPASADAVRNWRVAQAFIQHALEHMNEEEAGAFRVAADSGVPGDVLAALRREHAALRCLAAELLWQRRPDEETALDLMRFLHRFQKHVAREEHSLAAHTAPPVRSRR